jgi:magnesium transporter
MSGARWIDLVDPTREELLDSLPEDVDTEVVERLASPPRAGLEPRPLLEGYDRYVVGVFLDARPAPEEDRVSYREVDVFATPALVVTVRKTPEDGHVWDSAPLEACKGASAGELVFRLVDDVAESFLDVVDTSYAEIDELEDHIEDWPSAQVRRRLSTLRHDLLHARRTVSSTRSAVRRVVDKRLDVGEEELFPEKVERMFADTYETLFRAGEELDVARDLLSSSRDFHQSMIAENQNEVVKKLTVIASLLLLPTLVVGFYGQNFESAFDDYYWTMGVSLALIVGSTLVQLALFRWRRWI